MKGMKGLFPAQQQLARERNGENLKMTGFRRRSWITNLFEKKKRDILKKIIRKRIWWMGYNELDSGFEAKKFHRSFSRFEPRRKICEGEVRTEKVLLIVLK